MREKKEEEGINVDTEVECDREGGRRRPNMKEVETRHLLLFSLELGCL